MEKEQNSSVPFQTPQARNPNGRSSSGNTPTAHVHRSHQLPMAPICSEIEPDLPETGLWALVPFSSGSPWAKIWKSMGSSKAERQDVHPSLLFVSAPEERTRVAPRQCQFWSILHWAFCDERTENERARPMTWEKNHRVVSLCLDWSYPKQNGFRLGTLRAIAKRKRFTGEVGRQAGLRAIWKFHFSAGGQSHPSHIRACWFSTFIFARRKWVL